MASEKKKKSGRAAYPASPEGVTNVRVAGNTFGKSPGQETGGSDATSAFANTSGHAAVGVLADGSGGPGSIGPAAMSSTSGRAPQGTVSMSETKPSAGKKPSNGSGNGREVSDLSPALGAPISHSGPISEAMKPIPPEPLHEIPRETLQELVQSRAYELWQEENCPTGKEEEHWLRAESETLANTRLLREALQRR